MKTMYQSYKEILQKVAKEEKAANPKDKPRVNYVLNCELDALLKDLGRARLREEISEAKYNQLAGLLTNYTIKLHAK